MAIDLERARTFVETHGSALEEARLHSLLDGVTPDEMPEALSSAQNDDGGFAFDLVATRPSSLVTTAHVLSWLRDLRLNESPKAQQAIDFIVSRQTPRGIWREHRELQQYNPPLWMDPESSAADVYTTALCASTILTVSDDDLPPDLAVNWLQTQQSRDGLLIGFKAHSSWLAVPTFAGILGQETRATRRLIAGLGELLADDWPGSMVAWLLQSLLSAGYTQRTEVVSRAWVMLSNAQQADGSFTTEDDDSPVQATLRAIDVVQRIGKRHSA